MRAGAHHLIGILLACVWALQPVEATAAPALHVVISVSDTQAIPSTVRRIALDEAARVWRPYDVAVDEGRALSCATDSLRLAVIVDSTGESTEGENGLGSIRFSPDGSPESTIHLHYRSIEQIALTVPFMGTDSSQWPMSIHDEMVGRAAGRALAHEIGHFLLRWGHHAATGLMQAELRASALTGREVTPFALTDVDVARLALVRRAMPTLLLVDRDPPGPRPVCQIASGK